MENKYKKIEELLNESEEPGLIYSLKFPGLEGKVADIERAFITDQALHENDNKKILLEGMPVYDETGLTFSEPFFKRERMIILGAGHVAVPLSMMAKMTGFYVVVIDDREDFANKERFPYADEVICDRFERAIKKVEPTACDYIVIITRGHMHDTECVETLLKYEEPVYTGLIGSRRRVAQVFEGLVERGFSKGRLDNICTPIGLAIGAKTIEEIDISIMAEVIKRRRMDSVGNSYADRGDHDQQSMADMASITKPCAIATILWDQGSTPRAAGASMAIFVDGTIVGSIGGGCIEGAVMHTAKELIGTGSYKIIRAKLDGSSAMAEGMTCGGEVVVLIEDANFEP